MTTKIEVELLVVAFKYHLKQYAIVAVMFGFAISLFFDIIRDYNPTWGWAIHSIARTLVIYGTYKLFKLERKKILKFFVDTNQL